MNKNMKTGKEKFCYLTSAFPKSAFMLMIIICKKADPDKAILIYPSQEIFPTIDEAIANVSKDEKLFKEHDDLFVKNTAILIPLTFENHYPLRREFWDGETYDFSLADRVSAFVRASVSPDLYQVLVTPVLINKKWQFTAPLPFLPTEDNKTVDQFMLHSNWQVDVRAKYAGIYKMEKPEYIDLETKQITPKNLNPQVDNRVN